MAVPQVSPDSGASPDAMLHSGDAYSCRGEFGLPSYDWAPALRGCQRMVEAGRTAGLHNRMRLQKPSLDHGDEVRFFVAMMRSNSKFGPRKLPDGRLDEQELPTRDQPVLALNPKGDEHGNPP